VKHRSVPVEHEIHPTINYDNELIRKIFDDDTFWQNFNKSQQGLLNILSKETGLFKNPYLTSPSGFRTFAKDSLERAQSIVDQMVSDQSDESLRNYISNLDRLSDVLCRVIDLAEFIRVAHPSKSFISAAQEIHEEMYEFMNVLNTNVELYNILKRVLETEQIRSRLSEEEKQVGQILLSDFEKSGINMDPETRNNFINFSQQIAVYGQHFTNGLGESRNDYAMVPVKDLKDLDDQILNQLSMDMTRKNYKVPTGGYLPHAILRSAKSEAVRKKIWIEIHSTNEQQVELLETMLKYRGILAHVLGKSSYAEYILDEKMAKKPEHVMNFLSRLAGETKIHAVSELRILADLKQKELKQQGRVLSDEEVVEFLKPWDRDYYSNIYATKKRSSNSEQISSYFSLGVVMQGLSNLFNTIYGIQLIPSKVKSGETWNEDVRRLDVVSETEGLIGVVYCDLFQRQGKTPNPAHFTVCCSRKIYPDETEEELRLIQIGETATTKEKFQLPVISLVCNFDKYKNVGKCLLSLSDVETIFHEMGHAMHSMLGRTSLHNISGTRCATDFVELPSVLMEHFAKDPRVIRTFARHYLTDEAIPLPLLESFQKEQDFLKNTESYAQIKMALLDQLLHSDVVLNQKFDSTTLYHGLENKLRVFADLDSNWQGKFGHLFGYGSSYYSYLLDRAIAAKVWDHLFAKNPLDRSKGEKFKHSVLKWGGSRNPWLCVSEALDQPQLANGDTKAMILIGETEL
jgi:intermediate peptidase